MFVRFIESFQLFNLFLKLLDYLSGSVTFLDGNFQQVLKFLDIKNNRLSILLRLLWLFLLFSGLLSASSFGLDLLIFFRCLIDSGDFW